MTKPIAPEDIRVGTWLVITDRKSVTHTMPFPSGDIIQIPIPIMPQEPYQAHGIPCKVAAVSLPFVVARNALCPDDIVTIDLSRYIVRVPTQKYVNVFTNQYKYIQAVNADRSLNRGQAIQ